MVESNGAPYSDDLPEFFQIYLPSTWSQRMKIPPAFIKNFDGIVPVFVTLKTSSQLSWQVTTNKIDKNWFFEKGWPEFVQENSLKKWDFLTFCYDGNSSFYVNIFAINGIKKRTRTENLQENEASDLPAVKRKKYEEKRGRGRPKRKVAKPFFPEFFKVFLPQSLASQKILIPPDFIKHFNRRIQEKITLKDVEGKVWHVGVERSLYEVFIKGGWHNFVCNHYLEVGDFMVFKYVGSYSFLVKLFGPNGCKKEAFASKNIAATHVKIEQGTEEENESMQTTSIQRQHDHLLRS
ncbi:hypothetical protein ACJIZ3_015990 [Penstemon smallii]|uniref:TF-B3 domain-containing protein n=1 Tax=Penstemon smallii TaxID=265156 RepID=A0ABD3RP28_9LAMI